MTPHLMTEPPWLVIARAEIGVGRSFAARGHTARLIAAEFVGAFRQGGKNDGNDALAIAIAARQPTMRFVPLKTVEQQAILSWHRG